MSPQPGHQERKRTESMIASRYYWKGLTVDILRWIQSCSGSTARKSNGKEVRYHVNRLTKHRQWDEINPDTIKWELNNQTKDHKDIHEDLHQEKEHKRTVKKTPEVGDIIVFRRSITKKYGLPIGMGSIQEINEKGRIHFQWMENFEMQADKQFLP